MKIRNKFKKSSFPPRIFSRRKINKSYKKEEVEIKMAVNDYKGLKVNAMMSYFPISLATSSASGGATQRMKVFSPRVKLQEIGDIKVQEIVQKQPPTLLGRNLVRVYGGTIHRFYEPELVKFIKEKKWFCLNYEDFNWDNTINWFKETIELSKKNHAGLVKQVVLVNVNSLDGSQLISARSVFASVGGYFHPYKDKTFEDAANEYDHEIQRAINAFEKVGK